MIQLPIPCATTAPGGGRAGLKESPEKHQTDCHLCPVVVELLRFSCVQFPDFRTVEDRSVAAGAAAADQSLGYRLDVRFPSQKQKPKWKKMEEKRRLLQVASQDGRVELPALNSVRQRLKVVRRPGSQADALAAVLQKVPQARRATRVRLSSTSAVWR